MSDRKQMIAALQEHLVPLLRHEGFSGRFPHFRRQGAERLDLLSVQFNRWGGSFLVEIGKAGANGPVDGPFSELPAAKLTTAHLPFFKTDQGRGTRRRLAAGQDERFSFEDGDFARAALEAVVAFQIQAEAWWSGP